MTNIIQFGPARAPRREADTPARRGIHLHRVVEIPIRTLDQIARENDGRPDLFEQLRRREDEADLTRDLFWVLLGIGAGLWVIAFYLLGRLWA